MGVSDVTVLAIMFLIMVGIGIMIPVVQSEFTNSQSTGNTATIEDNLQTDFEDNSGNYLTIWKVFVSIGGMFTWTSWLVNSIPFYADLIILFPIRAIFYFTLVRNIWIGGGG